MVVDTGPAEQEQVDLETDPRCQPEALIKLGPKGRQKLYEVISLEKRSGVIEEKLWVRDCHEAPDAPKTFITRRRILASELVRPASPLPAVPDHVPEEPHE